MKTQILHRAARITTAAGLALFVASCEKSAPGLGKAEATGGQAKEASVYDGIAGSGTASAAPSPTKAPTPASWGFSFCINDNFNAFSQTFTVLQCAG